MRLKKLFLRTDEDDIMEKIKIGDRYVGKGEPTFIIAEGGLNHNGDIDIGKELVKEAKNAVLMQ